MRHQRNQRTHPCQRTAASQCGSMCAWATALRTAVKLGRQTEQCTPSVHREFAVLCAILRPDQRPSESQECLCRANRFQTWCSSLGSRITLWRTSSRVSFRPNNLEQRDAGPPYHLHKKYRHQITDCGKCIWWNMWRTQSLEPIPMMSCLWDVLKSGVHCDRQMLHMNVDWKQGYFVSICRHHPFDASSFRGLRPPRLAIDIADLYSWNAQYNG